MARLTLRIDEELLKQARIHALEQGTSVNALVRDYLERLADQGALRDADPLDAVYGTLDSGGSTDEKIHALRGTPDTV